MTAWVAVGIALMVLGAFTTVWISFAGATVIGSTPVFFTLRAALAPRRSPPPPVQHHADSPARTVKRDSGAARRRTPARRRGHD